MQKYTDDYHLFQVFLETVRQKTALIPLSVYTFPTRIFGCSVLT